MGPKELYLKLLPIAKRKNLRCGKVVRGLLGLLLERGHRAAEKWQPHRTVTMSTFTAAGETTEKDEADPDVHDLKQGKELQLSGSLMMVVCFVRR